MIDVSHEVEREPQADSGIIDVTPVLDDARMLRLARDAYKSSTDYFDTNVRRDIETDLRHWQGMHAAGSRYHSPSYGGRSKLFTPKTRAAVLKAEAQAAEAFFSSIDVVNLVSYDRDDKEQEQIAKFFRALLQRRLSEPPPRGIPWYLTCLGGFQDALVTGVICSHQYWDMNAPRGIDRPMIDLMPLENFRFDPAADWRDPVGTSPYLVRLIPMYVKDVRQRMKDGRYRPMNDAQIKSGVKRFSDSIRLQRDGKRGDSQDISHDITDFSIVMVHENIVEVDGEDWLFYTLSETELLSKAAELVQMTYPQGRPFTVGFATVEAHKHYPASIPKITRDVQRELNELRNQRIDNVSFVLNKRYFAKRNKQVDIASIVRNVPGSVTLMQDPDTDVRVVETPDVTSSSYQEQDRLNLDFDDVAGQFSSSSVQSNRQLNETVGGMNILTANGNQVTGYRLRTFVETWVEPALRQVLELERHMENDQQIIEMSARAAGMVGIDDAIWQTPLILQVNVGMGATNPQEKAGLLLYGFTAIKDLLADGTLEGRGLNVQEVIGEVFAMLGYRDGSRFFAWGDEDPQVVQMRQMIEQLQAQLEAKHPQAITDATVRKMDAETIGKITSAIYESMQAGQVIAAVPSVAPIADEVMRSAGYKDQGGADPNFPQPAASDMALTQDRVFDPRTGIGFEPINPAGPDTGGVGGHAGAETLEGDGVLA